MAFAFVQIALVSLDAKKLPITESRPQELLRTPRMAASFRALASPSSAISVANPRCDTTANPRADDLA